MLPKQSNAGIEMKMYSFARTFAFARTDGGMTLSGPKACRGSTKDARILPVFLHSAVVEKSVSHSENSSRSPSWTYTSSKRGVGC